MQHFELHVLCGLTFVREKLTIIYKNRCTLNPQTCLEYDKIYVCGCVARQMNRAIQTSLLYCVLYCTYTTGSESMPATNSKYVLNHLTLLMANAENQNPIHI